MELERIDFLKLASAGAAGASGLAMALAGEQVLAADDAGTSAALGQAMGPGLDGPYLDLRTAAGNQIAYARMSGDLDESKQKSGWFKGYVMAVRPGEKVQDLFGFEGFGMSRLHYEEKTGLYQKILREVGLYTDLKTGEVLEEWNNPFNNETVKVVQIANDPYNFKIGKTFPGAEVFNEKTGKTKMQMIPFILPWQSRGGRLELEMHIHLLYKNKLDPEIWKRESAGPMVQASEMFNYHLSPADMQNEKLTTLSFNGTWGRITPWLPWMYMGQAPGHCVYNAFMGSGEQLDEVLSRNVLDYIEKNYPKYFNAPDKWEGFGASSLENYVKQQTPAPFEE